MLLRRKLTTDWSESWQSIQETLPFELVLAEGGCGALAAVQVEDQRFDPLMEIVMDVSRKTLGTLFEQLGLPNDDASIDAFIQSHTPLNIEEPIWAEPFWSSSQASFLREMLEEDADWAEIVDELSNLLHKS